MTSKLIIAVLLLFTFSACDKTDRECPGPGEKSFPVTGFTKVTAGDNFVISLTRGNDFLVKARGCAADIDDLEVQTVTGGFVNISYKRSRNNRNRVYLEITLPSLNTLVLSGVAEAKVTGFSQQTMLVKTVLSGASFCNFTDVAIRNQAELSGNSELRLHGAMQELKANVGSASKLDAYGAPATTVDIYTDGASRAYVVPTQNFTASANSASIIYYKGSPVFKDTETNGAGKIIKE